MLTVGLAFACLLGADAALAKVTPIQKVIQLMDEMMAKGDAETKAEAVRFSAFDQWCKDQSRQKQSEIDDATDRIEELSAKIEKATAFIAKLTDRIEELDEDVGRWEKDTKAATEVREKEAADYRATSVDYDESIDAIAGALVVLKKKAVKTAQAEEALLQVQRLRSVPASSKKLLMAFIQQGQPAVEEMPDDHLSYEAPEAYDRA